MAGKLTAEKIPAAEMDKTQKDETLLAVNLLLQFFFREAQNNGLVRRFLIHRINKEMQEGVAKGGATVNKIIKGLKVSTGSAYFSLDIYSTNQPQLYLLLGRFTTLKWGQRLHPSAVLKSTVSSSTRTKN